MTLAFQTDNIFYVPPGETFTLYDIAAWRRIDLDILATRASLVPSARLLVGERAEFAMQCAEEIPAAEAERSIQDYISALPFDVPPALSAPEFDAAFLPLRPSFWIRMTQHPAESFFMEDYEISPPQPARSKSVLSAYGAVAFDRIGDIECSLPSVNPPSFHLCADPERQTAHVRAIDPLKPLPLLREYCGAGGSSNQGDLVTIDHNAAIPESILAAMPIGRDADRCFATLYFSMPLDTEYSPILPVRPREAPLVSKALDAAGFAPARRTRRFGLYSRGRDIVQVYRNLPGKETYGAPILPPFCLAALADGRTNPKDRQEMIREIFGM